MNVNHRSSKIQVVLDSNCNFYMHRIFIMNSEYIKKIHYINVYADACKLWAIDWNRNNTISCTQL